MPDPSARTPAIPALRTDRSAAAVAIRSSRAPPGPSEPYDASQELVSWMERQRAQFGEIYQGSIYGRIVYFISNPDDVQHILRKNWQNYTKGPAIKRVELLLGRGLMTSEGDLWKRQRRLIQPAFHDQVISGLAKIITDANTSLLSKWEAAARNKTTVNVTHDISRMIMEVVLVSIFGEDYAKIASHFFVLAEVSARDLQFAQAFKPLRGVVVELAAQRRAEQRTDNDFLGILMEARDRNTGERMSYGQLAAEILTLVVAGHETTAATLSWVWYLLAENPDVAERLSGELKKGGKISPDNLRKNQTVPYINQIIEETLRLYPAGWLVTRRAIHDDQIGGYRVPAGTEIYISPYIIQRHPDFWEAPEQFDPDRFDPGRAETRHPLAMLPFSAGPRNCIGEQLARFEMQLHLLMIGRRLRLRRADNAPLELEFGVNLRNKYDFIMVPEMRTRTRR